MTDVILVPNNIPQQTGIFVAVSRAYSLLSSNPTALVLFIISILSIIAEHNKQEGPFEIIRDVLNVYITNKNHPAVLLSLATLILGLVNFIIKFKNPIFLTMLVMTIPITYPNKQTTITVLLLLIYCFLFSNSVVISALIVQSVFVYYSLENITEKIFVIVAFVYLMAGAEQLNSFFTPRT
nr:MAG: ORF4 protein [Riboviria sp.]